MITWEIPVCSWLWQLHAMGQGWISSAWANSRVIMAKEHTTETLTGIYCSGWSKLRGYWLLFHYNRQLCQRISLRRICVDDVPKLITRKKVKLFSFSLYTEFVTIHFWLTNKYEAILQRNLQEQEELSVLFTWLWKWETKFSQRM